MKREALIIFLIILALTPIALSQSIDAPIKKITYHTEQYETGNINYAQLIVYINSLKQELAEEMGATAQGHDAVLKAEQLESALGKPTETTKWAWAETDDGNGHDKKLENEAPAWRKIIFDGKKIQLWLDAWPNVVTKNNEEVLFYRLHLDVRFKRPEEQINIRGKIDEIKSLAEKYSSEPGKENLETLARESVAVEQSFNNYFNQNPAKCEELMNDLFGSENKRDNQKILVEEIDFFEGDDFEARIRLEMCDDCEWSWINLNMNFESRGRFERPEEKNYDGNSRERYTSYSSENFKEEAGKLVDEMREKIETGNYQSALESSQELRTLTEAWNEKSNDVWRELEDKFRIDFESMTQEERDTCQKDYCWIKKEQERREAERELRSKNYEERKQFYLDLFSDYEKKEFYYEQEQWEKRLVEEFKEFGEEMCDNNADDNNNGQVDCGDAQCGGKVCGYETLTITDGEATREEKVELYCIAGTCQKKEEIIGGEIAVCGNHVCEENESELCAEDCATCFQHEALQCAGEVIFSGEDETGCPLEPVCLSEDLSCQVDEDCADPLCGDASCVDGTCQIAQLTECREAECVDGEEKTQQCETGETKVTEKCVDGLWRETGIECEAVSTEVPQAEEQTIEEDVVGDECVVKSDCGNENDVCSNGKCVTLPQTINLAEESDGEIIRESPAEETSREETEDELAAEEQQEPAITGEIIFSFFKTLTNKLKLTGLQVEEGSEENGEEENSGESNPPNEENEQQNENTDNPISEENDEREEQDERERDERREREEEEKERRENECSERCSRECYDGKIRPCAEECIREQCGNEFECNIDDAKTTCESQCGAENNLESCKTECSDKCLAGKETWVEPERKEHKEEKFVFTVGGACRTAQGKTEGNIWFGGWGGDEENSFNDFHLIKNNYYSRGGGDWCEEDLNNLIKQREELENSLNQEFASWFFEKYVANSADDWEKHISGIFELYWKDVDISRQMMERMQCLRKDSLPEHNLINFKYETDYGSIEFWEEVKTAKIHEDGKESQIISPYMKTWLFPSRDFFKAEMKRAMDKHQLPGPPEEENKNTLSEEEKRELREDGEFMEGIRNFNNNYGENLVIQFKDFDTNEVVFNIYAKINEDELMYFEPMPPAENPAQDVKVELDVDKLLDIVEYGESGRIELESPPWDRQPRVGFAKGAIDGVKMYFMFRSLLGSAVVTPQSAENDAQFFVRNFFEVVMGGDENRGDKGPEENMEGFDEEFPEELTRE